MLLDLLLYGPLSAVAAWALTQESVLRFYVVPKLWRQQCGDYQLVSREESALNTQTMDVMRKQMAAMSRQLEAMKAVAPKPAPKPPPSVVTATATGRGVVARCALTANPVTTEFVRHLSDERTRLAEHREKIREQIKKFLQCTAGQITDETQALFEDMKLINADIENVDQRISDACDEMERAETINRQAAVVSRYAVEQVWRTLGPQPRIVTWGGDVIQSAALMNMGATNDVPNLLARACNLESRDAGKYWTDTDTTTAYLWTGADFRDIELHPIPQPPKWTPQSFPTGSTEHTALGLGLNAI